MSDLEDFLNLLEPAPSKPLAWVETDDEPDDLFDPPPAPPSPCTDPDEWIERIRKLWPSASQDVVQGLVRHPASSDDVLRVFLKDMVATPRRVLALLLEKGYIDGHAVYDHDQGCADVRKAVSQLRLFYDVPLRAESITDGRGRRSTRYLLDPTAFRVGLGPRAGIPKQLRDLLLNRTGCRCAICQLQFPEGHLQADHRVPRIVVGDRLIEAEGVAALQPLCPSCNTGKRNVCAVCPNYESRDPETCLTCYWAYPEKYEHIAGRPERRLVLVAQTPEQMVILSELEAEARHRGIL